TTIGASASRDSILPAEASDEPFAAEAAINVRCGRRGTAPPRPRAHGQNQPKDRNGCRGGREPARAEVSQRGALEHHGEQHRRPFRGRAVTRINPPWENVEKSRSDFSGRAF